MYTPPYNSDINLSRDGWHVAHVEAFLQHVLVDYQYEDGRLVVNDRLEVEECENHALLPTWYHKIYRFMGHTLELEGDIRKSPLSDFIPLVHWGERMQELVPSLEDQKGMRWTVTDEPPMEL